MRPVPTIVEEVPGVTPRFFVSGGPFGWPNESPQFDTVAEAREWLAERGYTDSPLEYFHP